MLSAITDLLGLCYTVIQDCALALGEAFKAALGERRGIRRYGTGFAPLDEVSFNSVASLYVQLLIISTSLHRRHYLEL